MGQSPTRDYHAIEMKPKLKTPSKSTKQEIMIKPNQTFRLLHIQFINSSDNVPRELSIPFDVRRNAEDFNRLADITTRIHNEIPKLNIKYIINQVREAAALFERNEGPLQYDMLYDDSIITIRSIFRSEYFERKPLCYAVTFRQLFVISIYVSADELRYLNDYNPKVDGEYLHIHNNIKIPMIYMTKCPIDKLPDLVEQCNATQKHLANLHLSKVLITC